MLDTIVSASANFSHEKKQELHEHSEKLIDIDTSVSGLGDINKATDLESESDLEQDAFMKTLMARTHIDEGESSDIASVDSDECIEITHLN